MGRVPQLISRTGALIGGQEIGAYMRCPIDPYPLAAGGAQAFLRAAQPIALSNIVR